MQEYLDKTDEQLAVLAQQGELEAFEVLMTRYQKKLLGYGRKVLFNHSDLEDIVQEVFIKAYKNFQSFDSSRKFSSWLYRIAHNEFINHGKKFSRQLVDYFDLEVFLPNLSDSKDNADEFDRKQLSDLLELHVSELPEKYREPIVLYAYEQLSYQDISDILRIPVSTIGVRIKRARDLLKAKLNNNDRI